MSGDMKLSISVYVVRTSYFMHVPTVYRTSAINVVYLRFVSK
jgi:hypothetical protein